MQRFAAVFIASVLSMLVIACKPPEDRIREILVENSELLFPEKADLREIKRGSFAGIPVWCGQINARNALGARTGWNAFFIVNYKNSKPQVTILDGLRHYETAEELRVAAEWQDREENSGGMDLGQVADALIMLRRVNWDSYHSYCDDAK